MHEFLFFFLPGLQTEMQRNEEFCQGEENGKMKQLLFAIVALLFLSQCQNSAASFISVKGQTMGTFYSIKYQDSLRRDFKDQIDSVLKDVNQSLSTYIPTSTISRFNQSKRAAPVDKRFRTVFAKSAEVVKTTSGAFDPTVMPLVNAYGFGFTKADLDPHLLDSLRKLVGFNKVWMKGDSVYKKIPGVMLDFSAIAKGYGVDEVGKYLEKQGIHNYAVEIGGEVRARGENARGAPWLFAIEKPQERSVAERSSTALVRLKNISVATSGNYRNYYYKNGKKYAHTIDPKTGKPALHHLLSASVFAPDCMTADAYATACMVLGTEKAKQLAAKMGLNVFLIYENKTQKMETFASKDIKSKIKLTGQ